MRSRRDFTRIIFEILSLANGGISKTGIVYKANLNFRLAGEYISLLMTDGMLKCGYGPIPRSYRLTEKGERFLSSLAQIERGLTELLSNAVGVENVVGDQSLQIGLTLGSKLVHAQSRS